MDNMDLLNQALAVSGWGMLWGFGVSTLLYGTVLAIRGVAAGKETESE